MSGDIAKTICTEFEFLYNIRLTLNLPGKAGATCVESSILDQSLSPTAEMSFTTPLDNLGGVIFPWQ